MVGQNVALGLDVIFNTDVNVQGLNVKVEFTAQGTTTPVTLYLNDFPSKNPGVYHDGDEYKDAISWMIPSFAPLGHYHCTLKLHGQDANKDINVCLITDFDIQ